MCPLACVVVLNGTYYLRQLYTNTYAHKHTQTHTHTHEARTHTWHSLRRAVTRRNKILLRRFTISAQRGTVSQVTKGPKQGRGGAGRRRGRAAAACTRRNSAAAYASVELIKYKNENKNKNIAHTSRGVQLRVALSPLHSALPLPLCPPT